MAPPELRPIRVLYSFHHRLGAPRICWTAWQQVIGLDAVGAEVNAVVGSALRTPPESVRLVKTLALGKLRVPFRLLGARGMAVAHDWIASRWLKKHAAEIDIVHAWPMACLRTLRVAKRHGIPVLMERPNAHTAFAFRVVEEECKRIDFEMPAGYESTFDAKSLALELKEYEEVDYLLCPSPFVAKTFVDEGEPATKLLAHQYGYDSALFWPGQQNALAAKPLVMIYVGLCTPRKGLHHTLKAWLASTASKAGRFMICGEFVPGYREKLGDLLDHPGIEVLGQRNDVPALMRQADLFVLSSVEEGSALVTYEARGSGCVLLVSDAAGAVCRDGENALVHPSRDAATLTKHLDLLDRDRNLLWKLRDASIRDLDELTWRAAGRKLLDVYREVLARQPSRMPCRQ